MSPLAAQNNALPAPAVVEECVILLHGLGRSAWTMKRLANAAEQRGYRAVNQNYPSRQKSIPELSQEAISNALAGCGEVKKIHFITHSMGGILVRYYLQHNDLPQLGRVVMISPPNQGSEVVDKLKAVPGFSLMTGKAGQQLGTDKENSLPLQLGGVDYETGVITGNRSIDPISSILIPGENDGKVSVERAKLEGMADFLVLPYNHAFIMRSDETIQQTFYFIRHGQFLQKQT